MSDQSNPQQDVRKRLGVPAHDRALTLEDWEAVVKALEDITRLSLNQIQDISDMRNENARLREAAERAAEWHETAGKALSKGPWTGDAAWRWDQHTEQGTTLRNALAPQEPGQ